jgi:hypothetical protein
MAKFLNTAETVAHLDQIVRTAKKRLVLVSPYLQLSTILFERLKDAVERGVTPTIVYGKDELKGQQLDQLGQLERLDLRYLDNLHAKCYLNEQRMIITSMNMYDFSQRNREMGLLLEADEDPYQAGWEEVSSILKHAEPRSLGRSPIGRAPVRTAKSVRLNGHCIRCSGPILLESNKPLCKPCYEIWAGYSNPDYPESVCHRCGKVADVSVARPLCRTCFGRWR